MGLGKTIQSIAGMSIYHEEWPVLVLTPSSARYHWSAEFENWLGKNSSVNQSDGNESIDFDGDENSEKVAEKVKDDEKGEGGDEELNGDVKMEEKKPMELLDESNIYVVNRSRDDLIPHKGIRVVICSYGLAPALVEQGKLTPGLFKCAIVDESHMLKNSKTKRTKTLMPILRATSRCILLSGTPALARPAELWPQLHILGTESEDDSWMKDEQEFMKKYGRDADALQNAELHTMLTSTVMIRRLKADILKTMPPKFREKATVNVCTPAMRDGFKNLIQILRGGNGVFGKLATQHNLENPNPENDDENDAPFVDPSQAQQEIASQKATKHQTDLNDGSPRSVDELNSQYSQKMTQLKNYLSTSPVDENTKLVLQQQGTQQIEMWYQVNSNRLQAAPTSTNPLLQRLQEAANGTPAEGNRRGTVLSMMYNLTAEAKKPLIVDMVRRWVDDPSKGKLCIFAHHLSMLDEIVDKVGLSNVADSQKKYIRIDGSTTPLERQSQIKTFQTDPNVRIAVLGLTAAGVAVTLTASSTVWFTELFWTPALMIQAEG
jgi:SNF2 family DNA or RNA helicase